MKIQKTQNNKQIFKGYNSTIGNLGIRLEVERAIGSSTSGACQQKILADAEILKTKIKDLEDRYFTDNIVDVTTFIKDEGIHATVKPAATAHESKKDSKTFSDYIITTGEDLVNKVDIFAQQIRAKYSN